MVEGKTWIDAQANYDGDLRTGRFFNGDFTGVGLHLRGFEDTYRQSGQPMDFVSHVDLLDPQGNLVRHADIRVNHPASIDGVQFFQYGFGWAPVVEVRERRRAHRVRAHHVRRRTPAPEGVPQLAMPWHGILKLPSLDPQMGMSVELWPDSRAWLAAADDGPAGRDDRSRSSRSCSTRCIEGDLTDPSLDVARHERDAEGGRGRRRRGADRRPADREGARRRRGRRPGSRSRSPSCGSTASSGEPRPRGALGVAGGYPRAARAPARALHVATQGLGAGGAEREPGPC